MERIISKMLQDYEAGKLTRRQLVGGLAAFASGTQLTAAKESTFRGVGLNHIAIRVTNVQRSRDFYQKHFGMPVLHEEKANCFLGLGKNFLTLFENQKPGRCRRSRLTLGGVMRGSAAENRLRSVKLKAGADP